jgi:hypothetical protein
MRESQATHPGPAAVVAAVVDTVRLSVTRDAARIDGVDLGAGGHAVPAVWFRGPEPKLAQDEFDGLWPNSGGWYELQEGPVPVDVRLTAGWPVPFPVPAAVHLPLGAPADQLLRHVNPEELALEASSEEEDG